MTAMSLLALHCALEITLVCLILLCCYQQFCAAAYQDDSGFIVGRATNYGSLDDHWTIHEGSCGYGYLDPDKCTGWDVAALNDGNSIYPTRCGRCVEVKCAGIDFKDGYGEFLQRSSVCRDMNASVVVALTDSCPCDYPANQYSNKRWCCNDMPHLDMSVWAFEKLADRKWGVIGIKYREVSCDYQPTKSAYIDTPSPGHPYPSDFKGDKRNCSDKVRPMGNDARSTDLKRLG